MVNANESSNVFHKLSTWFTVPDNDNVCKPASYKLMLRYAKTYDYCLLFIGIVASIINGAILPVSSIAFSGMVNTLTNGQTQYDEGNLDKDGLSHEMIYYSVMYLCVAACNFVFTFIGTSSMYTLCERQVHIIRKHFFKSILNQDMEYFDNNEIGSLTHKISSNIEKIKDGSSDKISILLQAVGALLSGIIIAFLLNWKLALINIVIVPFIILSLYGSARALSAAIHQEMSVYSTAGAIAEEVLHGIKIVMSFNAQEFEVNRYKTNLEKGRKVGIRKAAITAFFAGVYMLIMFGAMALSFYYGAINVINGYVEPGTVFACFWSVLIGAMRMGQAIPQINVIMSARVAAGELFEIIDRKPKIDCSSNDGITKVDLKGDIELKNVEFSYPKRKNVKILKGISLKIEAGKSIALVGHSGCGKSTIIGLLMRYYEQSNGDIMLDNNPIKNYNIDWLRKTIGIVSQESVIFQTTILENIKMSKKDATLEEVKEACIQANAHEFIVRLQDGYNTYIGEGGVKLSGGQKQRIAIARALLKNPKILLLDEATSALDTESERIVQEALEKASSGRTTITIAHRLSTVKNADKIFVFEQGTIIESGSHEELFNDEHSYYRQLVLAQQVEGKKEPSDEVDDENKAQLVLRKQKSDRLRNSIANVRENPESGVYIDDKKDDLENEGTTQASALDILKFGKTELKYAVVGFILSIIRGAVWPLFSLIYGQLFIAMSLNDYDEAFHKIVINSVSFAGIGLLGGISSFTSGFCLGSYGERISMKLRLAVYKNLLRQDCSYFDSPTHSVAILTSRLSQDSSNVQAAIDQRLAEVLQGITALVAGIIVAFSFGYNFAPFCIGLAILLVITQTIISSYLKKRGTKDAEIAGEASKIVTESIEYIRTVQALTKQIDIFDNFTIASKIPHKRAIIRGMFQSLSYAISGAYVPFNFFASYMFGMWLCVNDYAMPFTIFQVIEALNMAAFLISASASYFPEYIKAKISAGLMFNIIKTEPKIDNLSTSGFITQLNGNIELENIRFTYPNANNRSLILNGLNIKVNNGQSVALVGPSGSGKSTVIQLLERYYDAINGSVKIDGNDIREINIQNLRNYIALVGQEPVLFNLPIKDNIKYGLSDDTVTDNEIKEAAKLANIHNFIESLPNGYETSVGGRGSQLSGGQKQRIAIARAMIRKPKILLLDEATAALDNESEKLVQEALDKAKDGRTCVTVAHRLSTIQNSDVIYVLQTGRCVEYGDHQQLLERAGLYYKLVKSQSI